jgi:hypothetical protein
LGVAPRCAGWGCPAMCGVGLPRSVERRGRRAPGVSVGAESLLGTTAAADNVRRAGDAQATRRRRAGDAQATRRRRAGDAHAATVHCPARSMRMRDMQHTPCHAMPCRAKRDACHIARTRRPVLRACASSDACGAVSRPFDQSALVALPLRLVDRLRCQRVLRRSLRL